MQSQPFWHRSLRISLGVLVSVVSVLASPSQSQAQKQTVTYNGMDLGILNVTGYGFAYGVQGMPGQDPQIARGNIQANFTPDAGATNFLKQNYVPGLAYMQTVTFTFASGKQQQIFSSVTTGKPIPGTFTDGPQGGYLYRNGNTSGTKDTMPFYNGPPNSPGATPVPKSFYKGNQFSDTPGFSFLPDINTNTMAVTKGIGDTLNGMDGSISFETALVGVVSIPNDKLGGTYQVNVLQSFTWGATFTYDKVKAGDINDATSYNLAAVPLKFTSGPSAAFISAYDKQGPNANIEWLVSFTPEPGVNALLFAVCVSLPVLGSLHWKRRNRRKLIRPRT